MRAFVPLLALGAIASACDEPGSGSNGLADTDGFVADVIDSSGSDGTDPSDTTVDTTPDGLGADTVDALDTVDTAQPDTAEGPPPILREGCIDGDYDEALPDDRGDIAALVAGYDPASYHDFVDAVLGVRYPHGQLIVRGATAPGASFDCVEAFTSQRSRAQTLMTELSTVVHECGHMYDLDRGSFSGDFYLVAPDVTFSCSRGDAQGRGGDTFARSRMNGDAFASAIPGDFYRDVYLDGDPDDGTFDSGDQGFNSVLEEATQYINSLVTDWVFRDSLGGFGISARDGILTFLWYIERYLHMARNEFPTAYQRLSTDPCWREAILTVWGRAWFYLEVTDGLSQLGIDDATIEAQVTRADLLSEIERLRDLQGCR